MKDYLNINEAARETGKSIPTIRAKIKGGKLPNAHQVPDGKRQLWRIPLSDLINSGLLTEAITPPEQMAEQRTTALEIEIDRLKALLERREEALSTATERIAELQGDKAKLYARLPLAIETQETQARRRFSWFKRNPQTATETP